MGAPALALNILCTATFQLENDVRKIKTALVENTHILGPRISRRISAVLTTVHNEITNAREQDTLHGYNEILTFDLIETRQANVLESLIIDCTRLRESTHPCDICIRCPRCGGKGNSHCELPGTHGEQCIKPTD